MNKLIPVIGIIIIIIIGYLIYKHLYRNYRGDKVKVIKKNDFIEPSNETFKPENVVINGTSYNDFIQSSNNDKNLFMIDDYINDYTAPDLSINSIQFSDNNVF